MNRKDYFTLRTVRRKLIMISKLAGIILMISYVISTRLFPDSDLSVLIWLIVVILLVLTVDYLMGRFISEPLSKKKPAPSHM